MDYEQSSQLSSAHSVKVSLKGVLEGTAGLDMRKQALLDRVPNIGDWAKVDKESVDTLDLAFLSAKTNHEFALLKGKKNDILFHGEARHCVFDDDLVEMLKNGKLTLYAHTHPDYETIVPSDDDRDFLEFIGQDSSKIVSWISGREISFTTNKFDI